VTHVSLASITSLVFTSLLWSVLSGCSQTPNQSTPLPPQGLKAAIDPTQHCKKPDFKPEWWSSLRLNDPSVVIRFHVTADGHAIGAEVVRSSGSRDLDQAAIDALLICKFRPALENGKPVEGYADIQYIWDLGR
jgi:TonB family protein